ncbi:MAG TPA: TIGR04442 family protein [Geobacterales bacterium]|nr:TIGR04442 family protein [Geobacterales bacterium]
MQKDIRLHGITESKIEYYLIAAGVDAHQRFFFNVNEGDGEDIRFFSPSNEFILGKKGIRYRGNGGSFCEYMFGVDQPLSDLAKGDVINRMVMYGAHYENESGGLTFSDRTEGNQSFERIFFDGNAVCNYFFFVHTPTMKGALRKQQEEIVKLLGKTIKRSIAISEADDNRIIEELFPLLGDEGAQLFLFKLIDKRHEAYRDLFRDLYLKSKKISDDEFMTLSNMAIDYGIDRYQQERIRIDVMYKHPDNKRIVDEYKNILIDCEGRGEINKLENARLTRLKTLSVRNKIPAALFYTLDEMLKKDKKMVDLEEMDYISETRQILAGIFLSEREIDSTIDREDMIKLLHAKKRAAENRDHTFEEILLDASKACDEKIRDGAKIGLLEGFSYIITYFDRYDSTASMINQLAFMENVRISDEMVRSILGNKAKFDALKLELFGELFMAGLFDNKYIGKYGRRKVETLVNGIQLIEENRLAIPDLLSQLSDIDQEERIFTILQEHVRERIRNFYSKYATKADQDALKAEVIEELRHKKLIADDIPDKLFEETILSIKTEAVYLHNLLPKIIAEKDVALREDFLENSGLDRFYVEELEREYYELNGLNIEELYHIRKGLS